MTSGGFIRFLNSLFHFFCVSLVSGICLHCYNKLYNIYCSIRLNAGGHEAWKLKQTIAHVFNGGPFLFCERLSASILFYFSILTLHMHELLNVLQIEERSNISNWCIDLYWPLQFWRFVWCWSDSIDFSNGRKSVPYHHKNINRVTKLKVSHFFII